MKKPPIPHDETMRLARLKALNALDTGLEERFDRLTRIAERLFRVPIAVVTLVAEERVWFKSCVGLPASEMPRDVSFCGHAIVGDGVFVIPDTLEDERFADNPVVTEPPHLRFYAGCPLNLSDGIKLGTLCILDFEPRAFSQEDIAILKDLAVSVESELATFELSTLDILTGLHNKMGFTLVGQQMLNLCEREGIPVSLAFMDLDEFKLINDKLGHGAGDRVLKVFADCLKTHVRKADLVARVGGDEFALLLSNNTKSAAEASIGKIRRSLATALPDEGAGWMPEMSCGIVEFDAGTESSLDALLEAADVLMYSQKKKGQRRGGD